MALKNEIHAFDTSLDNLDATGSLVSRTYKRVVCPFNQYEITLRLTPDNKLVEVLEVKINKDFLSHKQKMASLNSFDVDAYL